MRRGGFARRFRGCLVHRFGGWCLPCPDYFGQRRTDRHLGPRLHQYAAHPAILEYFDFDGTFVRFDNRYNISMLHLVAILFQPFNQRSGFHIRTERGPGEGSHG